MVEAHRALVRDGWKLKELPDEDRDNKVLALLSVHRFGANLEFVSERLTDDWEVVFASVQSYGYSLRLASERLRDDDKIVLAAVNCDGYALEFASERLRADKFVVETAITGCDGVPLRFAAPHLCKDLDFILHLMTVEFNTVYFCEKDLLDNEEFVLQAIKLRKGCLFASERLRSCAFFMFKAIEIDSSCILCTDAEFFTDKRKWNSLWVEASRLDPDLLHHWKFRNKIPSFIVKAEGKRIELDSQFDFPSEEESNMLEDEESLDQFSGPIDEILAKPREDLEEIMEFLYEEAGGLFESDSADASSSTNTSFSDEIETLQ